MNEKQVEMARDVCTGDPVFLFQCAYKSGEVTEWRTRSVWRTRKEAESYGRRTLYQHAKGWRVSCVSANGELAALLRCTPKRDKEPEPFLRRGWWNDDDEFDDMTPEKRKHTRDAFEFIDSIRDGNTFERIAFEKSDELLNRGTPPEPEWLPFGAAPDREGTWERKRAENGQDRTRWEVTPMMDGGLYMTHLGPLHVAGPVWALDHSGHRYRRIVDAEHQEHDGAPRKFSTGIEKPCESYTNEEG